MNRLTLSDDKKICGVCGGLAKYLDIDPTLVRIAFFLLCMFYCSGIIFYFLLACLIPKD